MAGLGSGRPAGPPRPPPSGRPEPAQPFSLPVLFAVWAAGLITGFGLVQSALAPDRRLPESLYLSGTTFTTLGYGDVTPAGPFARAVAAAVAEFGFFALVVGYLPAL